MEWLARAVPPSPTGFYLGQGETKDFNVPLTDPAIEINKLPPSKGMGDLIPMPTFTDVASGKASYYHQILFTYFDVLGRNAFRLTA